jgi:hypothetical protein
LRQTTVEDTSTIGRFEKGERMTKKRTRKSGAVRSARDLHRKTVNVKTARGVKGGAIPGATSALPGGDPSQSWGWWYAEAGYDGSGRGDVGTNTSTPKKW